MKISDLEAVQDLAMSLLGATTVLQRAEALPDDKPVECSAWLSGVDMSGRSVRVPLLAVPKEQVVSAARRERSKIVAKLQQLGVEVE